jgi:hypothetical protein
LANGGDWVQLDLRPVRELRPHEETIESNTREMVAQLKKDGVQKDPIIVDGSSGVVLDGMHRLSAFKELGIGYAACSPVDYGSENISLGRWLRIYKSSGDNLLRDLANGVGLTLGCTVSEALRRLDEGEAQVAALGAGNAFLPPKPGKIDDGFALLRKADDFAQSRRWERTFAGEEELESHARKPSEVVLLVRRFEKTEVLKAGMAGRLLPCKTSKHIVDPRPVAVNVPLDELKIGSKKTLTKRLEGRPFKMLPPDSLYEGRKYKERLLLLSGK